MHLPFLGSSERLWITLKMVWSLKKESTYNFALWENPFNIMETNMVPYKRIFISIFPNGEKLEITLISDPQNWLIYGGHTRQCSRRIVKWRDSTIWLGQNHGTLRISSHTEQKPWKKFFFNVLTIVISGQWGYWSFYFILLFLNFFLFWMKCGIFCWLH